MRFLIDGDYHIHSRLSYCSKHKQQTKENILSYAIENHYKKIVLTDHVWDTLVSHRGGFYEGQDVPYIASSLPLPQAEGVEFLFGCETDMDERGVIGLSPTNISLFDFIIVPTTHFSMIFGSEVSFAARAEAYVRRLDALLSSDLPFGKVGLAHATCPMIGRRGSYYEDHLDILDLVPDRELSRLFAGAAERGLAIELNFLPFRYTEEELPRLLRPYRIAKEEGCRFYFGSDAHAPKDLREAPRNFARIVELLSLEESDKFIL